MATANNKPEVPTWRSTNTKCPKTTGDDNKLVPDPEKLTDESKTYFKDGSLSTIKTSVLDNVMKHWHHDDHSPVHRMLALQVVIDNIFQQKEFGKWKKRLEWDLAELKLEFGDYDPEEGRAIEAETHQKFEKAMKKPRERMVKTFNSMPFMIKAEQYSKQVGVDIIIQTKKKYADQVNGILTKIAYKCQYHKDRVDQNLDYGARAWVADDLGIRTRDQGPPDLDEIPLPALINATIDSLAVENSPYFHAIWYFLGKVQNDLSPHPTPSYLQSKQICFGVDDDIRIQRDEDHYGIDANKLPKPASFLLDHCQKHETPVKDEPKMDVESAQVADVSGSGGQEVAEEDEDQEDGEMEQDEGFDEQD